MSADTIETADGPRLQAVIPGAERSAQQARAARDAKNGGRLRKGSYQPPGGMFDAPEPELFDRNPLTRNP